MVTDLAGCAYIGLENHLHAGICCGVFRLEGLGDAGDGTLDGGHFLLMHIQCSERLARDGVAKRASLEVYELNSMPLEQRKQNAGYCAVGVCPAKDDVHAGVASLAALDCERIAQMGTGFFLAAIARTCCGIEATGATDVQLPFRL